LLRLLYRHAARAQLVQGAAQHLARGLRKRSAVDPLQRLGAGDGIVRPGRSQLGPGLQLVLQQPREDPRSGCDVQQLPQLQRISVGRADRLGVGRQRDRGALQCFGQTDPLSAHSDDSATIQSR
jgi:hypothetical protein